MTLTNSGYVVTKILKALLPIRTPNGLEKFRCADPEMLPGPVLSRGDLQVGREAREVPVVSIVHR